jgi:hypothetical protein
LQLPSLFRLRDHIDTEQPICGPHLPALNIARKAAVGCSVVIAALNEFGIPHEENGHELPSQMLCGYHYGEHWVVKSRTEEDAIRLSSTTKPAV